MAALVRPGIKLAVAAGDGCIWSGRGGRESTASRSVAIPNCRALCGDPSTQMRISAESFCALLTSLGDEQGKRLASSLDFDTIYHNSPLQLCQRTL